MSRVYKVKVLVFLTSIAFLSGCLEKEYSRVEFLMDTVVEVRAYHRDKGKAEKAIDSALNEIKRIEAKMSSFNPDSELSFVNREAARRGKYFAQGIGISDELASLVKKSISISELTEGAFDITIHPLWKMWKFEDEGRIPDRHEINEKLKLVGYRNLLLEDSKIKFRKAGMGIDLGGIAKGYAVDCAVKILKARNITSAMVNAGGDIYVIGRKKGKKWRIGIRHPRRENGILGVLELEDQAVVTSGDYERFFFHGGKRYHHLLDPRTGYPAEKCQSVTIVAGETGLADGLATGVFVLGPEKGMELIEKLETVEGVIVDKEGRVLVSSGLVSRIRYADKKR